MKLQTGIGLLRLKNGYSNFMKLFFPSSVMVQLNNTRMLMTQLVAN